jgi:tRNA ligase
VDKGILRITGAKVEMTDGAKSPSPVPTSSGKEFGKTIIVPVAIPGCGKTTVSLALSHIFNFGHTQSDDVNVKKAAPVFLNNVKALLRPNQFDVVIADK